MEKIEGASIKNTDPRDVQEFDNEAMVLLSGGVDSAACIAFLQSQNIRASGLFINYGHSAAKQEYQAAVAISEFYKAPLKHIAVSGFQQWGVGFVPGRNAFLLHTALMAVSFKKGMVAIGIHSGTAYRDCSDYFLRQMQSSFDIYAEGRIHVSAPFLHWTKKEIWDYGRKMSVPFELTYSCEAGRDQACGQCLSCIDRGFLI
jgi:7-cyano-7-deazaguanine synthase